LPPIDGRSTIARQRGSRLLCLPPGVAFVRSVMLQRNDEVLLSKAEFHHPKSIA
jgi:hypothetical protein